MIGDAWRGGARTLSVAFTNFAVGNPVWYDPIIRDKERGGGEFAEIVSK